MMGGDGRLPNTIRCWFTEGERAVLSFIAGVVKKNNCCEYPIERIAAGAGVSIRLVQYTLAKASWQCAEITALAEKDRPPLLVTVEYRRVSGARNLPNVVKIISREWINWLSYQRSEAPASDAADDGAWSIINAYAGRLPRVLGTGCRKVHTSENPITLDVVDRGKSLDLSDNWQRLRHGLPSQEAYEGVRAPGRYELNRKRRAT